MNELNARQWSLYNLLKNNPDTYLKQSEICERLPEHYAIGGDGLPFHDTNARKHITSDIRAINNSDVIQKVIISNGNGVKIASKEEFERYIASEFAAIFRKLERTRRKARKAGLDGQMRICEGRQRDTIEAFADSINRLKAARLNKGLRLADVVCELKRRGEMAMDVSLLSKMENGHCKPNAGTLAELADIYGVEAFELIGGEFVADDIIA